VRVRARILRVLLATTIVFFAFAGVVSATVTSKTINTTNGECVNSGDPPTLADGTTPCGAAVYGATGFTGTITGTGTQTLQDYICVHTPSDSSFTSYGGTYTFTVYDSGNATLASTAETVTDGVACTDGNNAVTSGSVIVDFDANGGSVTYSVTISGVTSANAQATFDAYNSILNRVVSDTNQANSPSVAPPGPPGDVPEAPAAILLVGTAGLLGLAFVLRRRMPVSRAA
jgi:hypothetical protein